MPSPFPGMDPYLEASQYWPGLHDSLIVYIRDALQPQVRPGYYVEIGERIYFERSSQSAYPDVSLRRAPDRICESSRGGTAVAEVPADDPIIFPMMERQRETFLEIRAAGAGEVVTVLEIINPANKSTAGGGLREYLNKQVEVRHSHVNLVEIDLLREGLEVVAFGKDQRLATPAFDYIACITRCAPPKRCEVYVVTIRDRLPRIRIPLRAPDSDVVLDLPVVFTQCYDRGAYDLRIDYSVPPQVSLGPEDAAWAEAILAAARAKEANPGA